MISLVYIWSAVFVCGALGDSPTPPEYSPEPSSTEGLNLASLKYDLSNSAGHGEDEYKTYSPDVFPLFRKAVKELASSEQGILIFWESLNRPEPPRAFYDQVFRAYNRLADGDFTSSTETPDQATMYNMETTEEVFHDQEASELVSGVYTVDDVSDSSSENLHVMTSDGDNLDVYYTTESPDSEEVVLDEAYYASSAAPEQSTSTEYEYVGDVSSVHQDEESASETVESESASSESVWGDVHRSGEVAEEYASDESASSEDVWDNVHRSGEVAEASEEAEESRAPLRVGSIRGIPCEHFPCYEEIPITSFSCAEKRIPGVYADLETGCQVFHVCWPHRRESFLCPIGTIFNKPIKACDYWYSANCSLTEYYEEFSTEPPTKPTTDCSKSTTEEHHIEEPEYLSEDWFRLSKFVPVKSKVVVYLKPKASHKHHSAKKPVAKVVIKQKHEVLPVVEEFLEVAKNVAHDVVKLVPKVAKTSVPKCKIVKKPAAKLEPCIEIEPKPTPQVIVEPKPLPTLDPRFIVTPVVGKKPVVKVHYVKKVKVVAPKVHHKKINPVDVHKVKLFNHDKGHASEVVMKVLEMAGDVFQRDIMALTRQAMAQDYAKDNQKQKH